ncbi:fatty-acyl-CoA synthase [Mycolicibacterium insubricum]|uniref:Long-chain-fatty-acid--CoA ligase FadD13 n=1 Tax=Mycolicibacterium insubricum TaxID=444597 RepID=A0A1X0DJM6_9MYCO|nr:AMP-binding protein [Mycolicibacterium insubricum]MCB9441360.1 AMP-binding protein [Mycolicibacterium sp.]MCV7081112.1 AMP-binding protein [Mycolicibacterium insubricum]ORA72359.1 acyl-CoA synthetase [Mycolicibacterium insubricum]BBZ67661.1 fatty-acyl-CoA synthase [Mycolicibacterium insubricum]
MLDRLRALRVLARRGMIEPSRPDRAVHAARAIRRYGAFGGLLAHAAARYAHAPALTDDAGTVSFAELEAGSNALARGLLARGIGEGAVIALLYRNHRGILLALGAANKAGARVVLMNTGFAGPQLADVCRREQVAAVFADDEFTGLLSGLPESLPRLDIDELSRGQTTGPLSAPAKPGGMVLLTSGTTGTPKGAPRNKIDPLQSAQLLDRIPWPANSTYVAAAPLFHATGLATCALGLALGSHVVLTRRFDPETTLRAVAGHRASVLIVVPTMLHRILDLGPDVLGTCETSSLRVLFAAGSALSPDLCRRTAKTFGEVLYNLYGSTEVAAAAIATPAELRAAPGTVGRTPLGCRLDCYDAERRRITEPGKTGTLFVASGLSFAGYTDGNNKEIVDGLLSTGDTGHFDESGLWFVDGRDDEMIVSGGENVFPLEVENLLDGHPDVIDAAVIGVDDVEFGKRLCAFVVAEPGSGLDADAVRAFVRTELARHKVPRDVVFVGELPRNATGKLLKNQLEILMKGTTR